jgi:hypothetical protein
LKTRTRPACALYAPFIPQVVGDRASHLEYLRLATDALALVPAGDKAALAAAKDAALQVGRHRDWGQALLGG